MTRVLPVRVLTRLAQQLNVGDHPVEYLGEGDFFRAHTIAGTWVARVARHPRAARALQREACLLPLLCDQLPLAIPQPIVHDPGGAGDAAFSVHRLLPGPALTRARYHALPIRARDRCAGAVGHFLATLHATDIALAQACGVEHHDFADARLHTLRQANVPLSPFLTGMLEAHRYCHYQPVLLHGDLSPDHVLFDPQQQEVTGIIDFGDVAIGDPAWDFVYLYQDYGTDFLTRALRAYPHPDQAGLLQRVRGLQLLETIAWAVGSAGAAVGFGGGHSSSSTGGGWRTDAL
jgi:aminoglycoside 2''-phosphotransferase